jgi:hypothetical protein
MASRIEQIINVRFEENRDTGSAVDILERGASEMLENARNRKIILEVGSLKE